MAFSHDGLSVRPAGCSRGAGADKLLYVADFFTDDAPAVVEAANYFNAAVDRLPKNTVIRAVMDAGGTPKLKNYVVTANTGAVVTVALQTTTAG